MHLGVLGGGGDNWLTLLSPVEGDAGTLMAASPLGALLLTSSITCRQTGELQLLLPRQTGLQASPGWERSWGQMATSPATLGAPQHGCAPIFPAHAELCQAATPPNLPPVLSLLPALEADDQHLTRRPCHLQGVWHLLAALGFVGDAAAAQVQLQHRLGVSSTPEALRRHGGSAELRDPSRPSIPPSPASHQQHMLPDNEKLLRPPPQPALPPEEPAELRLGGAGGLGV